MKFRRFFFILIFFILALPVPHLFLQLAKSQQLPQANIPDSLNVRLVGRWAQGPCLAIAVNDAGTIACCGNGSYLEIVSLDNPYIPSELGKILLPAPILGIAIKGSYAYVADAGAGLRIIDISYPTHPIEIVSLETLGIASGLAIEGLRVYLAAGESGLRVIDISDPSNPQEIGNYDTSGWATKVTINGTYAYVADKQGGLLVIDISKPSDPTYLGSYLITSDVMDVAIIDTYAYVAAGSDGFRIIDIANPRQPIEVGSLDAYQFANGITARGTYAYLTDGESGLRIIDISKPSQPIEAGYYDTEGAASDVCLSGNLAFVADGYNGLRIINVSNYFTPNEIGFFNTDGSSRGVAVDSNYAYLVKWDAGLRIIDIADSSKPVKIGSLNLTGHAEDVVLKGTNAYLTNYDNGLRIIDISNRSLPIETGFIQNINSKRVAIKGDYAYVADSTFGLRIVDISDPLHPSLIDSLELPGKRAEAIAIKENYAYLAAANDGLRIIDISDFSQPVEIASKNLDGTAISIDVDGNYAYLGTLQNNLNIVDISAPNQPINVSTLKMYSPLYEITAKARYVYVANGASGLRVIDVINPTNPSEAGFYVTGSTAYGLTLDNKYIYLSCSETGLFILKFLPVSLNKPPLSPVLTLPVNKSFLNSATPQLTWQIPDDENRDLLHFKVELSKDGSWSNPDYIFESKNNKNSFSPTPPVASNSGSMNFTILSPLSENKWSWRVSAWDGLVYGEYSTIWSFTIDTTASVLNNMVFENPGFDDNWFNPNRDTSVTLIVTYDEIYPQVGSLAGAILLDTIFINGLSSGLNQEARFNFSIANQHDGTFPLQATIQDSAGNIGSKAWAIRFDSTPPTGYFSDAPDTIAAGQNYVVHVSGANDSLGCGVAKIYLDVFSSVTGNPTTVQDSIVGMTKAGIYFFRYFAEDRLANRGEIKTDTTFVIPIYHRAPIFPASQSIEVTAGDDFWIDIHVGTEQQPVENLFSANFILNYSNTQYVDVVSQDSILAGDLLGNDVNLSSQIDEQNGKITIAISKKVGDNNADGYGILTRIKYNSKAKTPDRTAIHFTIPSVTAADSADYPIELIPGNTTLWILQPFSDFIMKIIPENQTIHQGDSADFIISLDSLGVFNSQITLSITGIPGGMQAKYPSQPFEIPVTDTITFVTSDEVAPGFYTPTITATGGGIAHSDTVVVKVLAKVVPPDFVMTIQPEYQTIQQGESTEFRLSFQPIGEFSSQLGLEVSNLPEGMEAKYSSGPFTVPDSFEVMFSTTTEILPGVYQSIFNATGGGITHSDNVIIKVLPISITADFTMTVVPDSQTIYQREKTNFTLSFEKIGEFNSQISLEISDLPSGMDVVYPSDSFNIPTSFDVTFSTTSDIEPGIYHPNIKASGNGITHQDTVAINVLPASIIVQSFNVMPNPFTPNNDGYNDVAEFQYPNPSSGGISISIFDVSGRKIIEIRNSRYWYGKDDNGRDVKPGAYIYVVKNGDKVMAKGVIALAR